MSSTDKSIFNLRLRIRGLAIVCNHKKVVLPPGSLITRLCTLLRLSPGFFVHIMFSVLCPVVTECPHSSFEAVTNSNTTAVKSKQPYRC